MFKNIFIVINLLMFACAFIPLKLNAAAPTRSGDYTTGTTISSSAVMANENKVFNYLQAGVDTLAANSVSSSNIVDGTITNADISSSAAIADSKIVDALTISGGTINNSIIGGSTAAAITGTTITASTKFVGEGIISGWINFDGTGTIAINNSYNVSGITDNGTGNYTVSWDTDFASATSYSCTASSPEHSTEVGTFAAGSVVVSTYNASGGSTDVTPICLIAIGD